MATLKISGDTAERLVITADFAIRDEQNDARSQSLSMMSIAISLHRIANALYVELPDVATCKRCGLPSNAVIHSGRIESAIGGHDFDSETDRKMGGSS